MTTTEHSDPTLPRRPRLTPGVGAYLRDGGEVQVGLDPKHAVVTEAVPSTIGRMLRTLDGTVRLPALLERAGVHAEQLRAVLAALVARGLVQDAAPASQCTPASRCTPAGECTPASRCTPAGEVAVVVHGAGPLAAGVAGLLAASGVHQVIPECAGTVSPPDVGGAFQHSDVGTRRQVAVRAVVHRVDPSVATRPVHSGRLPDLVVLTDALVPPPELERALMTERQPHLLAAFRDGAGIVGPLVLPGRSSCLTCADLHRTDRDPHWPLIAGQLVDRPQPAGAATVQATAAFAAAQALSALTTTEVRPPLWNATFEVDPFGASTVRRHWPPHPRCDCGAFRL